MEEVAETLRAMGIPPFMADGAAKRISWLSRQGLKDKLKGHEPETYREVLDALKAKG